MTILILTPWYAPHAHPRAHRWTALAEYWAAAGHTVAVVAARVGGAPGYALRSGVAVYRCGHARLADAFDLAPVPEAGAQGAPNRVAAFLYRRVWKQMVYPDDALLWYRPALKQARHLMETLRPDALISVSLPLTAHRVGRRLHAETGVRWLADVGDPWALPGWEGCNGLLYGRMARRLEGRLLRAAQVVTVTGSRMGSRLADLYGLKSIAVIPPLLHPPWSGEAPTRFGPGFHVGFFGSMYAPMRTPSDMLAFLAQWRAVRSDLRCHLFGPVDAEYAALYRHYPWIVVHGQVGRMEARRAMAGMDVLISAGNAQPDFLPSKVVEYMASGKPVVHVQAQGMDAFTEFPGAMRRVIRVDPYKPIDPVYLADQVNQCSVGHYVSYLQACTIAPVASAYLRCLEFD